ncbi:hypothetical protein DYB25_007199 [Aphanomyces astaci]|uniref:Uncharacterized protein n=2 Tax=Aphanomyces astaci TaxID=112090 RepID=A0A397E8B1_APHAT|nr:hypothetical protein DYB36_002983 [Aphanomyces astaci]RHY01071.1 hypothetical protein DYB25_007199 [Aphanomyces astaci]RHY44633.1 hypothetical protein DYB34_004346 [Aphanomyces astaci]RHY74752.1 hypothetical protein DYB38_013404 [Aphanomyces astaci]RHY75187.1 hypothetical protein DYB30_013762 [Aphanomyces astaci]
MEWVDVAKDLNAGTIGGVSGIIAGHPLDTIKVRLQTQAQSSSIVNTFRSIVQSEGVTGLYKGILSPILSNAPINAVVFAVYGQVSRVIATSTNEPLTPAQQCVAGSFAGLFQVIFAAPAELVKITMQVNTTASKQSALACARHLARQHGIYRGLYRGWQLTMLRDVPAFGSYFFAYDVMKQALTGGDEANETTFNLLLAGGIAGSLSWMTTHPIDVIKSLVQSRPRGSTSDLVRAQLKMEGPRFLLKGFGATVARAFPVSAVTFLVYERTMQWMNNVDNQRE